MSFRRCQWGQCEAEAAEDRRHCEDHLRYFRARQRERRTRLRADAKCIDCGSAAATVGPYCVGCRDRRAVNAAARGPDRRNRTHAPRSLVVAGADGAACLQRARRVVTSPHPAEWDCERCISRLGGEREDECG